MSNSPRIPAPANNRKATFFVEVLFFRLEVQEHQDKEIQNQNGPGIDDNLDGKQEFGIQKDKDSSHMEQKREEGQTAMNRVSERHRENPCHDADRGKVYKEKPNHVLSLRIRRVLNRNREVIPIGAAFLTFLFLVMGV